MSGEEETNNKKLINGLELNMATVTNGVKDFKGIQDEDVKKWLRNVKMVSKIGKLNEDETFALIIFKLKDNAQSWASELLEDHNYNLTLCDLCDKLEKRFGNYSSTSTTLSSFLTMNPPNTKHEFSELLRIGTVLFEKGYMSNEALTQVLVGKCPESIKMAIFEAAEKAPSWNSFIQRAEQVAWVAFPDKTLNRVSNSGFQKRYDNSKYTPVNNKQKNMNIYPNERKREEGDLYCVIHGRSNHRTEECVYIIKQKEWVQNRNGRKVNNINSEVNEPQDNEKNEEVIKKDFIYSSTCNTADNPFFITVNLFGNPQKALVDTGADVSMVHRSMIPAYYKIDDYFGDVRSACGSRLSVNKQIKNIKLCIKDMKITGNFLITEKEPKYVIIGADTIKEYPEILFKTSKLDPVLRTGKFS